MEPVLLRVEEAARLLHVSRWTIYRWAYEGKLDATKIGKNTLRIFRDSVFALIEKSRMSEAGVDVKAGDLSVRV